VIQEDGIVNVLVMVTYKMLHKEEKVDSYLRFQVMLGREKRRWRRGENREFASGHGSVRDTKARFFTAERGLAVTRSWVAARLRHQADPVPPPGSMRSASIPIELQQYTSKT
jgi:hypothetical protein